MLIGLGELKNYVKQWGTINLQSIAKHFNAEPDFIRGMLSHWVGKGCIRSSKKTARCGSQCTQCAVNVTEIYEWVG